MGYEVLPVYDPLEALDLFREDPSAWDIVVTDQVMPKMKGLSVIRELKKIDPLIRVILYTGYSDMATEVAARAAGAEGFAYKPIPAVELAALLRDVMGRPAMVPAAG
jgi:DNA-binding NtrC family response regulator